MAVLLLVEDEPMIARVLADKLAREGHDIRRAGSCAEADRRLLELDCALAIVDRSLDTDGFLWASGALPSGTPWLGMVGSRDPDGAALAVRLGAVGVIVKPFKPTAVAATVAALVAAAST